ncbi:and Golgi organization 6 homolog [Octopus vulgaris]|uniref:And Golgi organization 6 homolog n=1 Tax=Octopus vulgaris TaxID=6645 RepID=A0AA36AR75_OCTVU|nr:and Golgi organization 6 homolog [Octopus vulgaris]
MESQLTITIEAMEILVSPGKWEILNKESSNFDELDFLLQNSFENFCGKLCKDAKFQSLNSFYTRRQAHYFSSESSLKWKFASTCLILNEALLIILQDLTRNDKVDKLNSKDTAPSDILSIMQQKVFSRTIQFIIYLGVYPYFAKGVGIPLQQRSDYGSLLLSCKPEAKSILERQFRLLQVARLFSVCLNRTSLGSLLLSRHLGDCLAVIFQLCYGVKKYPPQKPSPTETENNIDLRKLSSNYLIESLMSGNINYCDVFPSKTTAEITNNPSSSRSCNPMETSRENVTSHALVTVEDITFCQKFLEKLINGSYQPSLVRELVFLQGVPAPKLLKKLNERNSDIKFSPSNFSPAPQWLKNACSLNLTKILLKPNGVLYIVQGMLDASLSDSKNPIDEDKICDGISKVIANIPLNEEVDNYYNLILPQVNALLKCNDMEMSQQYLRVACCTMNIVCKQQPDIFEEYCLRTTNKVSQFKIPLMHACLDFIVESNGAVSVVFDDKKKRQYDFFSEDSDMIDNLMDLLDKIKPNKLSENLFIDMLQNLTQALTSKVSSCSKFPENLDKNSLDINPQSFSCNSDEIFYQLKILTFIAAIYEKQNFSSKSNTKYILEFIKAALAKCCCKANENEFDFESIFTNEILTMSLGLLTAVVASAMEMSNEEQNSMRTFIPLLQNVITSTDDHSIKSMASSLRIAVATYGAVWPDMDSAVMLDNEQSTKTTDSKKDQKLIEIIENSSQEPCENKTVLGNKAALFSTDKSVDQSLERENKEKHLCQPDSNTIVSNIDEISTKDSNRSNLKNSLPENNTLQPKFATANTFKMSYNFPKEKDSHLSELQSALKDTYDSLVPVQGHGLIALTQLIQNKDEETLKKQDLILHIFEEKLTHPDSYIYLSAVKGLSVMADHFPNKVVPRIIKLFQDPESEIHNGEAVSSELKIKLGECLVKVTQGLGETVVKFKNILLNAFLQGTKDNDFLVRASCLSNLGEVCKLLRFSLGNVIYEIFSCCSSLAKHDSSAEVRAAAVLLITQLLQGLGKDTFVLLEDILKDLYKLLKSIKSEEHNEAVKLQTNLALNELHDLVKDALFPKQVLTKRIRVLDPYKNKKKTKPYEIVGQEIEEKLDDKVRFGKFRRK